MSVVRRIVWAVLGLVVAVVLLFAVAAVALSFVDTRALQDLIAGQVEETTGRELHFEGDLELSFFPWLGFRLGETRLANAPGFGEEPFAVIGSTEMRVRVLPLLRRQVALDTIILREPSLMLAQDRTGRTNWDDLIDAFAAEAVNDAPPPAEPPAEEHDLGLPFSFRVEGFQLVDATIVWRDDIEGTTVTVRDLGLTTGPIEPDMPTPVTLQVTLAPDDAPELDVQARTDLRFTLAPVHAELTDLVVDLVARGGGLPSAGVRSQFQAGVNVDVDGGTAAIRPLMMRIADTLQVDGRVDVDFGDDTPRFDGELVIDSFDTRALARRLDIELPEMSDRNAMGRLAMRVAFAGTPDSVSLPGMRIELDDTTIEGNLGARLSGPVPHVDADFRVDAIDLDRYLPEATDEATAAPAVDEGDPVADLPREAMQALDADARLRIGRAGFRGLDATDVDVRVVLAGGVLTLDRGRARVAGGGLDLTGRIDARTERVTAGLGLRIDALQAEPLIAAFLGNSPLLGRMDSTLSLSTAGGTLNEWLRALNGDLVASVADGEILGLDLNHRLRVASASLTGQEAPAAAEERSTLFQTLRASAAIEDGMLRTRALELSAAPVRATGDGRIDLVGDRTDYTFRLNLADSLAGVSQELRDITIPLRMTGSLFSPRFSVAMDDVLRARVRARTDEAGDAAREAARREEEAARARLREEEEAAQRQLEQERRKAREAAEQQLRDRARGLLGN